MSVHLKAPTSGHGDGSAGASPSHDSGATAGLSSSASSFRRSLYCLFIVIAASLVTARIMRVRSPDSFSPTPFQSANDKSRWATIRALGDHGVWSIEHIIFYSDGSQVRGWHTIDLVRHRGPDGREHYYSSKPTLLSTVLAGQYWLIKQATGLSLSEPRDVWTVVRTMLVLTNVLPLVVALYLLARLIDELGQSDWGRLFTVAAACLATFVTTYSVTLNNHSLAACTLVFALAAAVPIWQGRGQWWHFALAGLFFALTAAGELPALAMLALAAAGLAWKAPRMAQSFSSPLPCSSPRHRLARTTLPTATGARPMPIGRMGISDRYRSPREHPRALDASNSLQDDAASMLTCSTTMMSGLHGQPQS